VLHDRLHVLAASSTTDTVQALFGAHVPRYLAEFCQPGSSVSAGSGLRSSARGDLVVVSTATDFGRRCFAMYAPLAVPAATRDQEQSVAGIFQVSTQDSSVQLH